jgi:hypothetical protein
MSIVRFQCELLQEYFVTVTRKLQVDARIARRKVELLAEFDVATRMSRTSRGHRPYAFTQCFLLGCSGAAVGATVWL